MSQPNESNESTIDPLARENAKLAAIAALPFFPRALGYIKRTGPGLLQSAMTLGAGSAAASVVAGASFGYKLLWVQPIAMFLGVMMFVALSNIVLTTKERPYKGFMRELGPFGFLVFLWAFGSVMASVIWHFPQYGLAAGAVRSVVKEFIPNIQLQESFPLLDAAGQAVLDEKGAPKIRTAFTPLGYGVSFGAGLTILLINMLFVFNYGRGGIGIRIYEWFLRCMIALVFLTFLLVVCLNFGKIDWLELFRGFTGYYGIPKSDDPAEYAKTITMVLGMLGAAVGINMTFLYPYSLLKKGWGEEHKTLVKWDLGMTMFLPFTVVTSLIMIGMTVSGIYDGKDIVNTSIDPLKAATALQSEFISQKVATIIFCGGLIGMTFGAISAHMTCCGFVLNEMFGLEPTTWRFRLFAMTPAVGIFGVVIKLPLWFPVATSAVCLTLLPIAYLIFFLLNNRRSYIGNAIGSGFWRLAFNLVLIAALLMATVGAVVKVKTGVIDEIPKLMGKK